MPGKATEDARAPGPLGPRGSSGLLAFEPSQLWSLQHLGMEIFFSPSPRHHLFSAILQINKYALKKWWNRLRMASRGKRQLCREISHQPSDTAPSVSCTQTAYPPSAGRGSCCPLGSRWPPNSFAFFHGRFVPAMHPSPIPGENALRGSCYRPSGRQLLMQC